MKESMKMYIAAVMGILGIKAFEKQDGKSVLLAEQRKKLEDRFGEAGVNRFVEDLQRFEAESGRQVEEVVNAEAHQQLIAQRDKLAEEMKQLRLDLNEAQAMLKTQREAIAKMEKEPADEKGEQLPGATVHKAFVADMTLAHNRIYDAMYKGAAYSGNDTIDTNQLRTEFGKYVNSDRIEIMKRLTGTTESVAYMTTIMTDKTEVRAAEGAIQSVLQQFVPKWTPKGKSEFKPLTIKNYKCKINVAITPSDIMEDILGYLYDENLKPEEMPIVKYILYELIFPKLDEEREQALAVGVYKESVATKDGDAASAALDTMDGYVTQLINLKKANNEDITWLLDGEELSDATLVEQIEKAVGQVSKLYKKKKMTIHADPDIVTRYGKAYRAKYPWLKNEDGEKMKVDFSNFTFAPLEGMRGSGVFFITPKENFKHLLSKNPQQTRVYMQTENYDVKIFAEWWEGTGFWLAEAIFAYIPSTAVASSELNERGI